MYELKRWLVEARKQWANLRAALREATGKRRQDLERTMKGLEISGKENAAKLKQLEAEYAQSRQAARALSRAV